MNTNGQKWMAVDKDDSRVVTIKICITIFVTSTITIIELSGYLIYSVNSKTQFLVNKLDISPKLSRAISGLQCGSIQNNTDCRNYLNFLQDGAEND